MTQYAFHFSGSRCTGCKTCELACKDYKNLPNDYAYRHVYEYETDGDWTQDEKGCWKVKGTTYYTSVACNHCDDPACVKVCPTGAMHKDEQTGIVSVDAGRCIGCGYCHMACPYNAPKVDHEAGHSVKCDGCAERVAEGKKPICVEACPLRALDFAPKAEIESRYKGSEVADIAPLPEKSYTHPNLLITKPAGAQPSDAAYGSIINSLEVR